MTREALLIWLAIVAVVFGAYALITTRRETKQVYVVVDSSFQMRPCGTTSNSNSIASTTRNTPSSLSPPRRDWMHSWQSELVLIGVNAFAPCDFAGIADATAEAREADERILITTSANDETSCPTTELVDWQIIQLDP